MGIAVVVVSEVLSFERKARDGVPIVHTHLTLGGRGFVAFAARGAKLVGAQAAAGESLLAKATHRVVGALVEREPEVALRAPVGLFTHDLHEWGGTVGSDQAHVS